MDTKRKRKPPEWSQRGWKILHPVHQAVRMAAASNDTTCQQIVNEILARELTRMGHYPPPRAGDGRTT